VKILVIAFPSGVQWQLAFDGGKPPTDPINGVVILTDDYGQKVQFTADPAISYLVQDTEELDKLQVAMMIRNAKNQAAAQGQFQSDPRNLIMRPGGLVS
jgi:hypothetical protein